MLKILKTLVVNSLEIKPPIGCNCILSEVAKICHDHNATCNDYDNSGYDWCYVSDESSCKEKRHGDCGIPWVKCEHGSK